MSLYPCCEVSSFSHIISKAVKCHCIHAVRVSSFSTSFPRLSNVTVSMLWGYLPSPHHFKGCQMSLYPCCESIFLLHIISKAVKCHCIHAVRVSSFSTSFPRLSNVTVSMLWVSSFSTSFPRLSNVTVSMLWGYLPSPHHFQGCQMSLYPCCEGIFLLHIISKPVKCHCIHAVSVSSFSSSFRRLSKVTVSMLWGYLPSPHHFKGC